MFYGLRSRECVVSGSVFLCVSVCNLEAFIVYNMNRGNDHEREKINRTIGRAFLDSYDTIDLKELMRYLSDNFSFLSFPTIKFEYEALCLEVY